MVQVVRPWNRPSWSRSNLFLVDDLVQTSEAAESYYELEVEQQRPALKHEARHRPLRN